MNDRWLPIDSLAAVILMIKDFSSGNDDSPKQWTWTKNMRCKYVDIRFDMRDGAFIMLDRNGELITMDDLKYQYDGERE